MKQSSAEYDDNFIDGREVESRGKFYTGASIIGGQVFYAASAYRSENLKNSKVDGNGNNVFEGGYREKPINEELHRKINERQEGYYYRLNQRKKGYTGTVWDKITATTDKKVLYTESIPDSFEVEVNGQKIWVHPNVTEHIGEVVKNHMNLSPEIKGTVNSKITLAPQQRMLREQHYLDVFVDKLEKYTKNGIKLGETKNFEGWEFKISQRPTDKYPVLNHAIKK